jgi:hypothetical protein
VKGEGGHLLVRLQSVSHLELQVFLTQSSAPNIPPRQIYHPTAKCILIIPSGLTCALHILQHTLKKMITENIIKGPQIVIADMIKSKNFASNIIVARNEGNDYIPALSERMMKTDKGVDEKRKRQDSLQACS